MKYFINIIWKLMEHFINKMEIDETFQRYHVNCLWNFLKRNI